MSELCSKSFTSTWPICLCEGCNRRKTVFHAVAPRSNLILAAQCSGEPGLPLSHSKLPPMVPCHNHTLHFQVICSNEPGLPLSCSKLPPMVPCHNHTLRFQVVFCIVLGHIRATFYIFQIFFSCSGWSVNWWNLCFCTNPLVTSPSLLPGCLLLFWCSVPLLLALF